MICSKCGKENESTNKFCSVCGNNLTQPEVEEPITETQPTQEPQQPIKPPVQPPVQPQQPIFQQPIPQYQTPFVQNTTVPGNGLAITSMVLGIVALVLCCIWYISIPCGIVGLVLGCIARNKASEVGAKSSMSTAGIACSSISLGLTVLIIILAAIGLSASNMALNNFYNQI